MQDIYKLTLKQQMKNLLSFILFLFAFSQVNSQAILRYNADTTKFFISDTTKGNEIQIANRTRSKAGGFLRNKANGVSEWSYSLDSNTLYKRNDSIFVRRTIGWDTIKVSSADSNKFIRNIVKASDSVRLNYFKANSFFDDGGTPNLYQTERSGNTLYGLLDDYTGEEVTFSKVTGVSDADVDGVLIRKKGTEYFRRVWDGPANIRWWGADPTGTSEATTELQKAINSGVDLQAQPGDEYLISPLIASTPGQKIDFGRTKLTLKPNSSHYMLEVRANNVEITGGIFDGNSQAGQVTNDFTYDHAAVAVSADSVSIRNVTSINSYGIGIKAVGTQISIDNCHIYNQKFTGIYIEPNSPTTVLQGIKITNNEIDGSSGLGGGIYITSFVDGTLPTYYQKGWMISGNRVKCATGGWPDEGSAPSCIYARAKGGIMSNNYLYGGYFGITEGGPGSVISGNRIETKGDSSLAGIEVHFNDNIISSNYIKGFFFNILSSGTAIGSNCNITGNNIFNWRSAGIYWQADPSLHSNNLNITNNIFRKDTAGANVGIYLTWPVQHVNITGNTFRGNNNGGGSGIVLERTGGQASITNNSFGGFSELVACYAAVPDTFNNILFCFNELSDSTIFNRVTPGGEGVLGTGIVEAFNTKNGFLGINFDRTKNVILNLSHGDPEGYLVASPGSIAINEYGGPGNTLLVKDTGRGVLGWLPLVTRPMLDIYVDKINDQTVRGIKTFKDVLRVDSGNILNGSGLSFAFDSVGAKIQSFNAKPLLINKLGNGVGIGNVIPTHSLDVGGEAAIHNILHLGSPDASGELWFTNRGDSTMLTIDVKDTATIAALLNQPLSLNPVANAVLINRIALQKLDDELNINTYVSGLPAVLGRQFVILDQLNNNTDSLRKLMDTLNAKIDSIAAVPGITDYVTLTTDQLITGHKTFRDAIKLSGGTTEDFSLSYDAAGAHIQSFNLKSLKLNEAGNSVEINGIALNGSSGRLTASGILSANDATDSSDLVTLRQIGRNNVLLNRRIDSIATGGLTDYVTLTTNQTITGEKTFLDVVKITGGVNQNDFVLSYSDLGGSIQTYNLKPLKLNELGNAVEINGVALNGVSGRLTATGILAASDATDSSDLVTYRQLMRKINNISVSGGSYLFANSVVNTSGTVTLVNDDGAPGNYKYYGTGQEGTKGFFDFPARRSFTLSVSNAYTVETGVKAVFSNYSGGTATITLPSAASNLDEEITVKNLTTNNVVVSGVSSIDTNTLVSYGAITYKSDGSTWYAIAKY
jgi:hypothetical protein